ncbi:SprB repeat-containing protein, partial [Flavobacterium sp. NAS39]
MKTIFTHSAKLVALLIFSFFSFFMSVAQTAPVIFPYNGFGIDGDLKANTPSLGIGDWISGSGGSGEYVFNLDGTAVNTATTYKFTDLYDTTSDNIFTGGGKFNDNPTTQWSWTNNKAGGKGDINNVLIHLGVDISNNQWLIIASDRLETTGTSYIDFEFFQHTLTANAGGTFNLTGGRTIGDILLSVEYSNGGSTAIVQFYTWNGSDYILVTNSSTNAFGKTNIGVVDTMTGSAFGTSQYTTSQFIEAAINISAFFSVNNPCEGAQFGSVLIKTKSSAAPSASLDDFAGPYPVKLVLGTASISYGDGNFCKNEGTVDVTLDGVTGGTFSGPAGLSINPTSGKIDIAASTSGSYIVTYSFTTGGCPKSVTTPININALPQALIGSVIDVSCKSGTNGSAIASATGGTPTYSYSWNTTPVQNTATASGLTAGNYTVTVTDSKGCNDTEQITIAEPTNALLAAINSKVDVNCKGDATGSATASATGGTAGYTYSWNTTPVQNTATASGLTAGNYTVTVTDSKGCTDTEQITIAEPTNALLAAINSKVDVNCKSDATGSATASATGGTAGYTYSWNTTPVQNTAIASGLTAGNYTVTVTDSKGCTDTEQITIAEPQDVLSCSVIQDKAVTANGLSDGQATVTPLGGNAGYTYLWDNGETTAKAV